MKKIHKRKFLIRRIVALVIVIFCILFLKNLLYNIFNKNKYDKTQILFNNEFVSLVNDIYIEDSLVYVSEEDIKNIFDETIYYNVGDKELITTYNKHVAVLHLDDNKMLVNDTNIDMQGKLEEKDTKVYLPIKDLEIVYDIETNYSENTNILIMDSTTKEKKQAIVLKNTKLRLSKLPFSAKTEKINRTDYVYIIEEGKHFFKVRTESGNIGYIKKSKLSDVETIREDYKVETQKINILETSNLNEESKINSDVQNFVILEDFSLIKNNVINSNIDLTSDEYINCYAQVSEKDVGIIGTLNNKANVSESLSTYLQRNSVINELYNQVIQKQYNGVCINFESIDDINSFYRFLIELTPKFKESGLKVIVKFNDKMDKKKLEKIVDLII